MKAFKIAVIAILVLNASFSLINWLSEDDDKYSQGQLMSQQEEIFAGDGLDLKAVTGLVKEVKSGQELERKLNEKDGINNLDLNGDKKVDYISVTEFGDVEKKLGFSLTSEPVKGEVQE